MAHKHSGPVFMKLSDQQISRLQRLPYNEYLRSKWWKSRRKWAIRNAGYKCQLCNARGRRLVVHHRTYSRLGREHRVDLCVLCSVCHDLFHQNGRIPVDSRTNAERSNPYRESSRLDTEYRAVASV